MPRSTSIRTSLPCRYAAACGRALVERTALLEQHRRRRSTTRAPDSENADAAAAGDRDQTAPVRIAAVNRRLHQQRVGDRPRRALRFVVGPRAGDVHRSPASSRPRRRGRCRAPARRQTARNASTKRFVVRARRSPRRSRRSPARTRVSLVEHSPSTVMALNVVSHASTSARCSTAGATAASRRHEPQHRRQHRLDHARALGTCRRRGRLPRRRLDPRPRVPSGTDRWS